MDSLKVSSLNMDCRLCHLYGCGVGMLYVLATYGKINGSIEKKADFDFLGQKVRSPGQVKVRCAPRDRLQISTSRCGHSYSPNDLKL